MYGVGTARFESYYGSYGFRRCGGSEANLISCYWRVYIQFGVQYDQNNFPSAGVICQGIVPNSSVCEENTVRLVNGSSELEGRVELCAYGTWVTMCDNGWDIEETYTVCKHLGYPSGGALHGMTCNTNHV